MEKVMSYFKDFFWRFNEHNVSHSSNLQFCGKY